MPSDPKYRLREISWGFDQEQTCIYDNDHLGPIGFLAAVKAMTNTDVPQDARDALTLDDVQHIRFRRMSPTEAQAQGLDWGVRLTKQGGYKVTAVIL